MQSIQDIWLEIKGAGHDAIHEWGLITIIVLLALCSFGLGRFSGLEDVRPPVSIIQVPTERKPHAMAMGGLVVASRTGSVYYYPWCAGAQKITVGNQVWFESEEAAAATGLLPAKGCKGLAGQ
jgi:hypothetical protein